MEGGGRVEPGWSERLRMAPEAGEDDEVCTREEWSGVVLMLMSATADGRRVTVMR